MQWLIIATKQSGSAILAPAQAQAQVTAQAQVPERAQVAAPDQEQIWSQSPPQAQGYVQG